MFHCLETKKSCADKTYSLIGSNCYKVYKKQTTQQVAKNTCKHDEATLASIKNELENLNELKTAYKSAGNSLIN